MRTRSPLLALYAPLASTVALIAPWLVVDRIVIVSAIWPLPSNFSSGNAVASVVPSGSFFSYAVAHYNVGDGDDENKDNDAAPPATLSMAFERYMALTFPHHATPSSMVGPIEWKPTDATTALSRRKRRLGATSVAVAPDPSIAATAEAVTGLVVHVSDESESHPHVGTDESYKIAIPACGGVGRLEAATVYGALRGLETFSQLVLFDYDSASYGLVAGLPIEVVDGPRFPHRGLMIDTARHYLPVSSILRVVDSMSYAKLNVLHWHVSDTQSFPLQFESRPDLWRGSYGKMERYLQSEVRHIVEHARLRGVRVFPEFDVPGHAASWCVGYPEICPSDPGCPQPLNVARDSTFDLLNDIVSECAGKVGSGGGGATSSAERHDGDPDPSSPPPPLFPDEFFHLGGDEVDTKCWSKDADISSWLKSKNMTEDDGYAYFVRRAASIAIANGRRPVQWSEVYDHFKTGLDESTVVHVWKSVTNITEVAANGYDLLINVGYSPESWYLDNLDVTWDKIYQNDPCGSIPSDRPDLCSKVLGGNGEMWGETVDASDLDATIWPRASAISERLWSRKDETGNVTTALSRIKAFRCLLNERGIGAAPVNNVQARSAPHGPGSCYDQRRRAI